MTVSNNITPTNNVEHIHVRPLSHSALADEIHKINLLGRLAAKCTESDVMDDLCALKYALQLQERKLVDLSNLYEELKLQDEVINYSAQEVMA